MNVHFEILLINPLGRRFRQQFRTKSWLICVEKISPKIALSIERTYGGQDLRSQHFLVEHSVHCVTSDSMNTNITICHESEWNAMKLSSRCQIASIFENFCKEIKA